MRNRTAWRKVPGLVRARVHAEEEGDGSLVYIIVQRGERKRLLGLMMHEYI